MGGTDLEAEYNNRARVPEHPAIMQGWARDAAAFRAGASAELAIPYGDGARTRLDLFWPAGDRRPPLAVFFHGGYWQALDRSSFSHMARGLVAHGVAVAVPSYDLCPAVPLAAIVDEAREAVAFLWRRHGTRPAVFGHSAGGHLTAALVATQWSAIGSDLPGDLVPAGVAVSGLFDLAPLVPTSVNGALGLDPAEARRLSPLFWAAPVGRTLDALVGAEESAEYLRQSRSIVETWAAGGAATRCAEIPGANHFSVIAPFADPDSAPTQRIAELAGQAKSLA